MSVLPVPADPALAALDALGRLRSVEYAEPDGSVRAALTSNDSYWPQEWGLAQVQAPAAWDTTTGTSSVVVAVLNTGVDNSQPDLQGKLVAGYDFVNGDSSPVDDNGHGTMVAGVLAADTNN